MSRTMNTTGMTMNKTMNAKTNLKITENMTQQEAFEYRNKLWHIKREREIRRAKMFIALGLSVAVILFSIIIGGFVKDINASETGRVYHKCYTNITVEKGDTLWAIATKYTDGSNAAVRKCVDEIKEINDLGFYDAICSGDRLIIPYYVCE